MGLGLSICGRILDEHNSEISVKSEVGKFTQFTIKFPQED
jgi:signal transduction histidine kinase